MVRWLVIAVASLVGCGDNARHAPDSAPIDAAGADAALLDGAPLDVAPADAESPDATPSPDAALPDATPLIDAAPPDDAAPLDSAPPDAAPPLDATPPDAAPSDAALPDGGIVLPDWSATGDGTLSGLAWDPSGELWISGNQGDALWVRRLGPGGDERWLDTVAAAGEQYQSADVAVDGTGRAVVVGSRRAPGPPPQPSSISSWVREYDSAGATRWTSLYQPVPWRPDVRVLALAHAAFPTRNGWLVAGMEADPFAAAMVMHYDHAGLATSRQGRLGLAGDSNAAFAVAESATGQRILGGFLMEHSPVYEAWVGLVGTAPVVGDFVFVPPLGSDGAVRAVRFIGTDVVACGAFSVGANQRAFIQRWSAAGTSRWRREVTGSGNDVCNALEVDGEDVVVAVTSAGHARVHRYDAQGGRYLSLDYGGAAGLGATAEALALSPDAIFLGGNQTTATGGTSWYVRRYPMAEAALWTVRSDSAAGGDDTLTGLAWDARGELWVSGQSGQGWVRRLALDGRELWAEGLPASPGGQLWTAGVASDGTGRALVVGTHLVPKPPFSLEPRRWARQYDGSGATTWTDEWVHTPLPPNPTVGAYGNAVAALPDGWLIAGKTDGIQEALMQRLDHTGVELWSTRRLGTWNDLDSAVDVAAGPGGLQAFGGHLSEHPTPETEGWIWAGPSVGAMTDIFIGPPAPRALVDAVAIAGGLVIGCGPGFLSAWTPAGAPRWQVARPPGERCVALAGAGNDLFAAVALGDSAVIDRYDSAGNRLWRSRPYAGTAARGARPAALSVSPDVLYLGGTEPTYASGNDWFVRAYPRPR